MIGLSVTVRDGQLRALAQAATSLRQPSAPEWAGMRRAWGVRYSAFSKRKFVANSRGGGDWPPLAPSTIAARRGPQPGRGRTAGTGPRRGRRAPGRAPARGGRSAGRSVAILRDTGRLFQALNLAAAGNYMRDIPGGIRFGIVGGGHGGANSIGQIARWHHTGAGHNPVRRILYRPDGPTLNGMRGDMRRAIAAVKARSNRGGVA